jgi:hypothetical protein
VGLLALIAGTVSYLYMHTLVELHRQPGWVAALTPLSVDGMIMAASTTLLADSRTGERGGELPWTLLVIGSAASLAANVAVAQPTSAGRVIAAWSSFVLIAAYELLMRQVRRSAAGSARPQPRKPGPLALSPETGSVTAQRSRVRQCGLGEGGMVRLVVMVLAGIFSGRRGSGRWLIGLVMARCPAGVRSPRSMVGTRDGAAWSNGQVLQASSAASTASRPCGW